MPDTENTPATEQPTEAAVETTETTEVVEENPSTEEAGQEPTEAEQGDQESKDSELPEWARNELTNVRQEAGKYRQMAREAKAALEAAKTPEEVEKVTADLTSKVAELEHEILRRDVATDVGLPKALAARLNGSTKEELEADAKSLLALVSTPQEPERLGGGLDPSDTSDDFDPVAAARKARRNRY